ncbi:MAG TPA: CDP-alcohol phosphatidyltransferase family protein [Candidatus Sulfotelmatobacter sp.]|nr:CDP-alcohol phosphatidyltransferase family protein [Candidatus Sulfotelmatobacter sp.]
MFDGHWREAVDRSTKPVGESLVRIGVTADVLTVVGLGMSVVTAFVVGSGHFVAGIAMLFATGLPDLFDGPVAKAAGTASVRGAYFDSVSDRVADGFMFGGIAWYLSAHHHGQAVLLAFAILAVVSLISYQRAKAEQLGIRAKGGLMERAERFILLGFCFIAAAISPSAFVPALAVYLVLVTITAVDRFVRVWQAAEGPVRTPAPMGTGATDQLDGNRRALVRWREGRVDSRWRAWRETRAERSTGPRQTRLRPAGPRIAGEPHGRWRARRVGAPSSRSGRIWRARRTARPRERVGRRA